METFRTILEAIRPILPETIVAIAGIFVMLSDAYAQDRRKTDAAWIAFFGLLAGGAATGRLWYEGVRGESFDGMLVTDSLRLIFVAIALVVLPALVWRRGFVQFTSALLALAQLFGQNRNERS
jgi:NADH:ubiquinone oxidoreductase subunit 2 (subunit N)